MKDDQMLKELIELAWKSETTLGELTLGYYLFEDDKKRMWACWDDDAEPENLASVNDILFNHDFAKAIFGTGIERHYHIESDVETGSHEEWLEKKVAWQYHLQQLAITKPEDRIKYAWENRIND